MLTTEQLLLLWGKTDRDKNKVVTATHPLLCHMIDVGAVVEVIWRDCLTDAIRQDIAERLGCDVPEAGRTLAFWASLHDVGKACPGFQRMYPERLPELKEAGLGMRRNPGKTYHGQVGGLVLLDILADMGCPEYLAWGVAQSLGGHHGSWPTARTLDALGPSQIGDSAWGEARVKLCEAMRELFDPRLDLADLRGAELARFCAWFSGLVSAADWIGSMTEFFPTKADTHDLAAYLDYARMRAHKALHALHWDAWSPPVEGATFSELFDGWDPRPMQQAVIDAAESWDKPGLGILEAPTGSGKTEAALYLADRWATRCGQRGLYVAMPTMATSNQMHSRASEMLARRHGGAVETLLVHSQARWRERPRDVNVAYEDEDGDLDAMRWFLPRKRSLLAPLGVGTVDQALMAVLQTRHFFVRLYGLAYKTIIFDEVHAYDTYMSELFERLLRWLSGMGCSVVILSATLPQGTRNRLLTAYGGEPSDDDADSYPRLSWVCGGESGSLALPKPDNHALALRWMSPEPDAIVDALEAGLTQGGCAAVICNTVARAQVVYRAVQARGLVNCDENLILFHARFPVYRRQEIEAKVLERFGKDEEDRPKKAIVVATQVIEQSLDLDFDLMISDMAPVDLLIQRAGRLHRHEEHARPEPLRAPTLHIACQEPEDGPLPPFPRRYIYAQHVMQRSWLALRGRESLLLPADLRGLIEAAYDDSCPADDPVVAEMLADSLARMDKDDRGEAYAASQCLIPTPEYEDALAFQNLALREEDPNQHERLQAHTRNGPPSITLVCLHERDEGLALKSYQSPVIDKRQYPNRETTRQLVEHSVSVSLRRVYNHFKDEKVPTGWARHPLLRYDRLAILKGNEYHPEGERWHLKLTDTYGLELIVEQEEDV